MVVTVFAISASCICFSVPFVWNVVRQLVVKYNSKMILEARGSGAGSFFNYEYHIAVFLLSINNCINLYIYLLSGATWRKKFIAWIISILRNR